MRADGERGQATPLLLVVLLFAAVAAAGAARVGAAASDRAAAQAAADAAALAGAADGRAAARTVAVANGAELLTFVTETDDVAVTVRRDGVEAAARTLVTGPDPLGSLRA